MVGHRQHDADGVSGVVMGRKLGDGDFCGPRHLKRRKRTHSRQVGEGTDRTQPILALGWFSVGRRPVALMGNVGVSGQAVQHRMCGRATSTQKDEQAQEGRGEGLTHGALP